MAHTIPFAFRDHTAALPPEFAERVITLIEQYESALRDSDVAGEPDDALSYTVEADTLHWALFVLLGLDPVTQPQTGTTDTKESSP